MPRRNRDEVTMKNGELEAKVSRSAFNKVWKNKDWVLVEDTSTEAVPAGTAPRPATAPVKKEA